MGTVGAIAGIINTGLSMIDKHIDDPTRRLKARQEYIDECKKKLSEVLNAKELEEIDKLLLEFIELIHAL